jgi:hypothetical protein
VPQLGKFLWHVTKTLQGSGLIDLLSSLYMTRPRVAHYGTVGVIAET